MSDDTEEPYYKCSSCGELIHMELGQDFEVQSKDTQERIRQYLVRGSEEQTMKYKILATYTEADSFEDALKLVGAVPNPAFEESPGNLFALRPDQIQTSSALAMFEYDGVYILQTPDAADELTDAEAQDLAEDSLTLAEMFLNEMDGADPFPRHDPPGIG